MEKNLKKEYAYIFICMYMYNIYRTESPSYIPETNTTVYINIILHFFFLEKVNTTLWKLNSIHR